jgi:hypothetical protein
MKLTDLYSLSTGLRHSEPYIMEDFVPVDFDLGKTILINTSPNEKAPSKTYDYWAIVVDELKKELGQSFVLVQISDKPCSRLNACSAHLLGLKPGQASYLISNCRMLLSGDHLYAVLAGKYKKDAVTLYGSTSCQTNGLNYFSVNICGTAPHPTYQAVERNKNINTIKPEEIVDTVLLNLVSRRASFETKYMGELFQNSVIEVIPDSIINPQIFPEHVFSLRMDYLHDENALAQLLSTRKYTVVANQEISIDLLKRARGRIPVLNFEVTSQTSIDYCKKLKHSGVKTIFFCRADGSELDEIRFRMLDVALVESIKPTENPLDKTGEKTNYDGLKFKTNKYLLSDGKIFLSHAHWKANQPTQSFIQNEGAVIDSEDFWKDSGYFCILERKF